MADYNVKYGYIFSKTLEAFNQGKKVIIHKGGTGCFTGDTLVRTLDGYTPISQINIGDFVYSVEGNKCNLKQVVNKYLYTGVHPKHKLITFVSDNFKIRCTYGHKFRINGEWVEAHIIAKRILENTKSQVCNINNREISNNGETLEDCLQESDRHNESGKGQLRVSENGNGWDNCKDSQDCSQSVYSKSRRESNSKSQEWDKIRQQNTESGVGDIQGKHRSCRGKWVCIKDEGVVEWEFQIEGKSSYGDKTIIERNEFDQKTNSGKIPQRNSVRHKGYSRWTDLETYSVNKIIFSEYSEPVYDITVDGFHSYLVTERNIVCHNSGKTYDLMIFIIFYIAMRMKDKIITIVSESKPHLDIGVIRILKQLMIQTDTFSSFEYNISTGRYTFKSGSVIEFFSADRIDKALGARRYLLYGNEINSLKFEVWDELARRSEIVIGDFNPTQQFWLEKFIEFYGDVEVITSNYTHNPFLSDTEKARIERRVSMDANFKRIHIDCEYGSYEGLVFTEFTIINDMPDCNFVYGLDFGFTNDPTALIKIGLKDDCLYFDEMIYRTGLTNSDITALFKQLGIRPAYDEIVADSAEPKSIEDILRAGYNVKPSLKGPDSIRSGIDSLKQYKLFITQRSTNLIKEFRNYSWIMDKEGNATNKPADVFNHGIDAIRYGHQKLVKPVLNDYFL
jgi:phage terminase large subunit